MIPYILSRNKKIETTIRKTQEKEQGKKSKLKPTYKKLKIEL